MKKSSIGFLVALFVVCLFGLNSCKKEAGQFAHQKTNDISAAAATHSNVPDDANAHSGVSNFPPKPIVLRGTIVTPTHIIQDGWIFIENQKIIGIYDVLTRGQIPSNAIYVDTKGIIFPGLVDLHNHVSFNVFPPWEFGRLKFSNRYEWRYHSADYKQKVENRYNSMVNAYFCQMNTYGELRALVGGTTSIGNTALVDCISGLVRNLDDPSQLDNRSIKYSIDIQNLNPDKPSYTATVANDLEDARQKLLSGSLAAFFIHLAEGKATDVVSQGEFTLLKNKLLLTNKTAIIHGIPLSANDFQEMANAGSSLIWSPQSNITLYGQTANILAAKNAGVRIALAPDWAVTGGKNMLDELHFAADWNRHHLNNLLSDKELVEMVTSNPARIAGVADKVGSIKVGLYADLLVISSGTLHPYSSLINAGAEHVKLVFVNGSPVYGKQDLMEQFWHSGQLEPLLNSSPAMVLKLPLPKNSRGTFKQLQLSLSLRMAVEGTTLAPLF